VTEDVQENMKLWFIEPPSIPQSSRSKEVIDCILEMLLESVCQLRVKLLKQEHIQGRTPSHQFLAEKVMVPVGTMPAKLGRKHQG
jgi:hypothetical protein